MRPYSADDGIALATTTTRVNLGYQSRRKAVWELDVGNRGEACHYLSAPMYCLHRLSLEVSIQSGCKESRETSVRDSSEVPPRATRGV